MWHTFTKEGNQRGPTTAPESLVQIVIGAQKENSFPHPSQHPSYTVISPGKGLKKLTEGKCLLHSCPGLTTGG